MAYGGRCFHELTPSALDSSTCLSLMFLGFCLNDVDKARAGNIEKILGLQARKMILLDLCVNLVAINADGMKRKSRLTQSEMPNVHRDPPNHDTMSGMNYPERHLPCLITLREPSIRDCLVHSMRW